MYKLESMGSGMGLLTGLQLALTDETNVRLLNLRWIFGTGNDIGKGNAFVS